MELKNASNDEIKMMVLIELEKMFTEITNKFNSKENHDMMLFLLDIESGLKEKLREVHAKHKTA